MDESEKGKQTPHPPPPQKKKILRLGTMDLKFYSLERTSQLWLDSCKPTNFSSWTVMLHIRLVTSMLATLADKPTSKISSYLLHYPQGISIFFFWSLWQNLKTSFRRGTVHFIQKLYNLSLEPVLLRGGLLLKAHFWRVVYTFTLTHTQLQW